MFRVMRSPPLRLGFCVAALVLLLGAAQTLSTLWWRQQSEQAFWASMPADTLQRYENLLAQHHADSDEAELIRYHFMRRHHPPVLGQGLWWLFMAGSVALVSSWLAWRWLLDPLQGVEEAAARMASGDYGVRSPEDAEGELGRLQHAFNALAGHLQRLEDERRELIASISHELRTPLTILQGRLHALCDGVLQGHAREHRRLLDQVVHLVRLVDDLNIITMGQERRLLLHPEKLELKALLSDWMELFAERAQALDMHLHFMAEEAWVLADPDRLRQILTNLIENALRYAAVGGEIDIALRHQGDQVEIAVSDRGPGLPDWREERVFGAFFRVDSSRNRHTGGSGLGLAVVHTLVELQGGKVIARQRPGGGAEFIITLPEFTALSH